MPRLTKNFSKLLGLLLLAACPSLGMAQLGLNANPLDPFPPNAAELVKLSEINKGLANAIESFAAGNPAKLKESLVEAKNINPDFPKSDVMLARMFMANRQWNEALAVLEGHLALNPNDAEAYKSMGEIAMVSGRWTDAWLQFEKANSLVETMQFSAARKQNFNTEMTKLRGETAERRQDASVAAKLFEELAKLQPKEGYPYWSLGRLKIASGDIDGGATLLKKGKQLTSSLPQAELAIALEMAGGKDRAKADKWFKDGIMAKDTGSEANWVQYIRYLIDDDKISDAKALIEKAPGDFSTHRDLRLLKAIIHRYLNEDSEAEKILSDLNRANPDDLDVADQLALVLVESSDEGKRARAGQLSEANLRQAQNVEKVVATAAWVKFRTGSLDIADKVLGEIVKGGRISPQTAYYAGMLLKTRGKKDDAIQFFKLASEAPGSFPQKKAAKAEVPAPAAPDAPAPKTK
ncbi:MAG: tetratricopeptide repeat protein [Pirellulaceae bacterium]|nr:tetratricopeptide repeat protein [Pirellulaceae bacterium]